MKHEKLAVIFFVEDGEVFAAFPSITAATLHPAICLCYSHTGQHGGVYVGYLKRGRILHAQPDEYADLLRELRKIYEEDGAYELVVRSRLKGNYHRARVAALRRYLS